MEEKEFPVWMDTEQVGFIRMKREGLYFSYNGRISTETDGVYRIYAVNAAKKINLGVCQPIGGEWVTQGRIPARQFDGSSTRFVVNPIQSEPQIIYPIEPTAACSYLEDLNRCHFSVRSGEPCIWIDGT